MRAYLLRFQGLLLLALVAGCTSGSARIDRQSVARLPYLGERLVRAADTAVARIPAFALTNQDGQSVTSATLAGRVYVTDFFFATCPSLCPKMQTQLRRVYEQYEGDPRVAFLSHTIDPDHDSLSVLRAYAGRLGVRSARQWHFVRAERDTVFRLARAYATVAERDPTQPSSLTHAGTLALVDGQGYLRGLYDGLDPHDVDRLLRELPVLLQETEPAGVPGGILGAASNNFVGSVTALGL